MTKGESIKLYQMLNTLGTLQGAKFAYAVSRNVSLLKPEIESLEKATEASEAFKKLDEERLELAKKFAKKNEAGEPIEKDGSFIMEDENLWSEAFTELKEANKETWEERIKQIEDYNELIKTDSVVELHKVSLNDIPANISVQQMYGISEMIDESTPSPYK